MNNELYNEYYQLKHWFDFEYGKKEQKYRRLIALDKKDKIIIDSVETEVDANDLLISLYEEAEVKRARIQELEVVLKKESDIDYATETK